MSVITVLPVSLRNKIAAGEVVERPASVVKELIENSIDAACTRISVETVRAGKKLIHVSDNGSGMDSEDAVRAFERYATSKIKEEQDLFTLKTMGFRGEALSSIAAVSKIKLMTALRNGENGTGAAGACVEIAGGEIISVKDCAASGTSIEVKELFFNTPARRKFLKSDATENYHIIDTVTREALSHPHLMFILRMDGSEVFSLPAASSLRERLLQLYGKDFIDGLIEQGSSYALDTGMTISVFTSGLAHMKNNRNTQFIFVNRRPVKDQSVAYAACKAYEGMVPREKHPAFFIFLDIDAGQVDFNVHPAKREVRFAQKTGIFDFVCYTVKEALKKDPGFCITDAGFNQSASSPVAGDWHQQSPAGTTLPVGLISEHIDTFSTGPAPLLYLGDTFVAVAAGGGLVLLDYHAAHERVNYERFLKRRDLQAYRLLFPLQVKLQRGEYAVLLEHLHLLNEVGLEAEDFGHDTILIRSIPEVLRDADLASLISDVAAALLEIPSKGLSKNMLVSAGHVAESGPVELIRKSIAARLACHSSIRGREVPDGTRVTGLLKSLDSTDNPNSCPHGRPTRIVISLDELRKMFKK